LNIGTVDIYSAFLSLNQLSSQDFPDWQSYNKADIISTVTSLKNKNFSGDDGMSNRILKSCGKYLGKPLAYIFNKSLPIGKYQGHLKCSVVNPLFN
jgi:hypothetical protein